MQMTKYGTIRCQCDAPYHQINFQYWDNDQDVYVYIHLNPFRFWKRLITAIKYIFNINIPHGSYEEMILRKEDAEKFRQIADILEKK